MVKKGGLVCLSHISNLKMQKGGENDRSSKMTNYRLLQLENKVAEHNNFARRMPVIEEQIKAINHRIDDLERGV